MPKLMRSPDLDANDEKTDDPTSACANCARITAQSEAFARHASHDLRAPLRQLTGFLDLLRSSDNDSNEVDRKQWLKFAADSATRLDRMFTGLLAYSRAGRMEYLPEVFQAGPAIAAALTAHAASIDAAHTTVKTAPSLPVLWGSEPAFVEVVQILVANALAYQDQHPLVIEINAEIIGNHAKIDVRDNGVGFEMRFADDIFMAFRSLHAPSVDAGVGIGLATARILLEANAAAISVQSEPGAGSTFTVEWPIASNIDGH